MARKKYGLGKFTFDILMFIITGGLWGFWLVFKFLRKNS